MHTVNGVHVVPPGCPGSREPLPCREALPQCSLEHGDEQVQQQDVGEEQVDAEQRDRQPLREGWHLPRGVALGALGLVGVSTIGAALVQVEIHAWCGERGWGGPTESRSVGRRGAPGHTVPTTCPHPPYMSLAGQGPEPGASWSWAGMQDPSQGAEFGGEGSNSSEPA